MNVVEKIKGMGKRTPITLEKAKMIAITGQYCSVEQRIANFLSEINDLIEIKAMSAKFNCLVDLPEDLISHKEEIQKEYENRGFKIILVNESLFILNWK